MEATVFIAAVIALYSGWVIYGKYKQYKAGNFCSCSGGCGSCSCSGCAGKASCGK